MPSAQPKNYMFFRLCRGSGGDRLPAIAAAFATGVAVTALADIVCLHLFFPRGRQYGSRLSLPRGWRGQAAVAG